MKWFFSFPGSSTHQKGGVPVRAGGHGGPDLLADLDQLASVECWVEARGPRCEQELLGSRRRVSYHSELHVAGMGDPT